MTVVHCKRDPYDVYIGRGCDPHTFVKGDWGNPYSHRATRVPGVTRVSTVEEAIERYRRDLWKRICSGELPLERLAALKGKTLGCWCAPGPCHGDVLTSAAAWASAKLARADGGAQ